MKYNRIVTQQVEAVQLISQKIDGDKVITKWSSSPRWLIYAIEKGSISYNRYQEMFKVNNPDFTDDLLEGEWVINEIDDKDLDYYVVSDDFFLERYSLDKELSVEKQLKNIYTHEFDIK